MNFDLWMPTASPMTTPELLDAVAAGAEERGIGTIWVGEHVVLFSEYESRYPYAEDGRVPAPPGSGLLEPLVTLTYLAARTSTVRLGTAMLLLPQRNPVYVAKEVSSLDWLSNGRVDLGVGVGWLKEEFEALNVPWERRGRRTDEYLEVLRTLWVDETSSYHGEIYDLPPCEMYPKPVQQPPPIHVGGETPAALRRAARFGQGWHTFNRSPHELVTGLAELDKELEAVGRRRSELRITVCPYFNALTPDSVEWYAESGADAVAALFFAFTPDDVQPAFDDLETCREAAARRERLRSTVHHASLGRREVRSALGAEHARFLAPPEGLAPRPYDGRLRTRIVRRNEPPTPRFILGDEPWDPSRQRGWGCEIGEVDERRSCSGGTTMVVPPGNEGCNGPQLTSPVPGLAPGRKQEGARLRWGVHGPSARRGVAGLGATPRL